MSTRTSCQNINYRIISSVLDTFSQQGNEWPPQIAIRILATLIHIVACPSESCSTYHSPLKLSTLASAQARPIQCGLESIKQDLRCLTLNLCTHSPNQQQLAITNGPFPNHSGSNINVQAYQQCKPRYPTPYSKKLNRRSEKTGGGEEIWHRHSLVKGVCPFDSLFKR